MLRHYLQWHITHRCNLSCKHCYQEDRDAVMEYAKMLTVLDKYESYIKLHKYEGQINLTGGEPLAHPDFFAIASEIRKRNFRLGILTNGTLIDDELADKIAKLSPVFVQLSLDGTKKVHDSIRGEGSFQATLNGIDCLKKHGIRVLVSFTAMKDNLNSMEELAAVCKKHHVDKMWWDRVVTDDKELYLTTEEFRKVSEEARKLKKKFPFLSNDRALQGLPENTCGYRCSAGKRLLVVLANGDMMACRRLPFIVGNILEDSKLEEMLLNSPVMNKLAKPVIPAGCEKCLHLNKCQGGAKCVSYAVTRKLGTKDINCYL